MSLLWVLIWISFSILLTPSMNNELNKIFNICLFYIRMRVRKESTCFENYLERYLAQIQSYQYRWVPFSALNLTVWFWRDSWINDLFTFEMLLRKKRVETEVGQEWNLGRCLQQLHKQLLGNLGYPVERVRLILFTCFPSVVLCALGIARSAFCLSNALHTDIQGEGDICSSSCSIM